MKPATDSLVVATEAGRMGGQLVAGVAVFRSIPYAAPPVGGQQFAAPASHAPWPGVHDARTAGATAPFPVPADGDIDG